MTYYDLLGFIRTYYDLTGRIMTCYDFRPAVTNRKKADGSKIQRTTKILVRNIPFQANKKEVSELFKYELSFLVSQNVIHWQLLKPKILEIQSFQNFEMPEL